MHHPPAYCLKHGLFPATGFGIGAGSMDITFIGCTHSCPHCGHACEVIPGVYDATPTSLNVLVDPSISTSALKAIKQLAERLACHEISLSEAKAEAEKISPEAAKLFEFGSLSEGQATVIAAVIGAIAIVLAARMSQPAITVNVHPLIERQVEQQTSEAEQFLIPLPDRSPIK